MHEVKDELFTVIRDRDLHDNGFKCVHFVLNQHVDLSIPLNAHDRRTIHLGAHQLLLWGKRFIRFHEAIITAAPERAIDFQI